MHRTKRWNILPPQEGAADLAAQLKTSPLIAQILLTRGYSQAEECRTFLRPSLSALHPPETLPGLSVAAERIARAIRDGEKVVIYGDYDVDGITATAILWHAIRVLGGNADFYIPHRIDEGYGLNEAALRQICDDGARLIVSVDCGVTAVEPAKVCRERAVDLIVTDHHEWREGGEGLGETIADCGLRIADSNAQTPESVAALPVFNPQSAIRTPQSPGNPLLPECFAIVHPRLPRSDAPYGNPSLCGAGVAFKLAWGIGQCMSGTARVSPEFRAFLVDATAFAALGTIADVVPLVGENRVLAHFGLGGLKQSKLTGIRALIESAGLTGQELDSYDVGFKLAPRLNACGRMGHARLAVEMLTKADAEKAKEIATYLEGQNRQRQTMERKIVDQAVEQVAEQKLDADDSCAIVLGHEQWHAGVIGIVASRLVDRYHRPAIMVALTNGHGQGSGRSIAGFHLAKALTACGEHLEAHGGHEMAAGLKLRTENFPAFREAFCAHASQTLSPEQLVPELRLDSLAELHQITHAVVGELRRLGPFGHGNRRPVLCCRGVTLAAKPKRVGKTGDHVQLTVRQGKSTARAIAFSSAARFEHLKAGDVIDLAVEPFINEYNGFINVELEVKDVQTGTGEEC